MAAPELSYAFDMGMVNIGVGHTVQETIEELGGEIRSDGVGGIASLVKVYLPAGSDFKEAARALEKAGGMPPLQMCKPDGVVPAAA